MKILRLAILCFLFSAAARAQSNYKPGYIISIAGDTVKGTINYREWTTTPKFIDFKSSATDKADRYTAAMLQCFMVNGITKYITYRGPISMNKTRFPDLPSLLDTTTKQDTVFLQLIYDGKPLSLFKHEDFKTRLFIADGNTIPTELGYSQYYTDNRSIQEFKDYINILTVYAQKRDAQNSKLQRSIETSKYDESDVQKVLKIINHDEQENTMSTFGSSFFAGIAANSIITEFHGQNIFAGKSAKSYIPRLSVGFNVFPNKFTQRLYLKAELAFSLNTPSLRSGGNTDGYTYTFKQFTTSLSPQAIYNVYNTDEVKVHLGAGVGLNYSFYGQNQFRYTAAANNNTNAVSGLYEYEAFWANLLLSTGITLHKKIEIVAFYMPRAAYSRYVVFSTTNRSYGIGLYYLFGK